MTRRKGTASGPVRRGGGAGQRVKQFAVERGIRVPAPLAQIIAPDTPATPYSVGAAVASDLASPVPPSSPKRAAGTTRRPAAKKSARKKPPATTAKKAASKRPRKPARRKSR